MSGINIERYCYKCRSVQDVVRKTMADFSTCATCGERYCSKCHQFRRRPDGTCLNCEKGYSQIQEQPDNAHYKMGGIDPCQYVEAMGTAEFRGACVLNILKYITRYPYKGTPLEDLAKAQDYLNKLIEHERAK